LAQVLPMAGSENPLEINGMNGVRQRMHGCAARAQSAQNPCGIVRQWVIPGPALAGGVHALSGSVRQ
jgi:hypothetical protein